MNAMNDKPSSVEQWGRFELTLYDPQAAAETHFNPLFDVQFSARFQYQNRVLEPDGFYDGRENNGQGIYRLRFVPDTLGVWRYETRSNRPALNGIVVEFTCVEPGAGNHGPVGVQDIYHFAYADGTPYFQVGTTCYAWTHQDHALEVQTLQTLKSAPFNKLRMCVFPKYYAFNHNEPLHYPGRLRLNP